MSKDKPQEQEKQENQETQGTQETQEKQDDNREMSPSTGAIKKKANTNLYHSLLEDSDTDDEYPGHNSRLSTKDRVKYKKSSCNPRRMERDMKKPPKLVTAEDELMSGPGNEAPIPRSIFNLFACKGPQKQSYGAYHDEAKDIFETIDESKRPIMKLPVIPDGKWEWNDNKEPASPAPIPEEPDEEEGANSDNCYDCEIGYGDDEAESQFERDIAEFRAQGGGGDGADDEMFGGGFDSFPLGDGDGFGGGDSHGFGGGDRHAVRRSNDLGLDTINGGHGSGGDGGGDCAGLSFFFRD